MQPANSYDGLLPDVEDLYHHLLEELIYLESLPGVFAENRDSVELILEQFERMDCHNWTLDIAPNFVIEINESQGNDSEDSRRDYAISGGFAVIGGLINVCDGEFENYALNLTFLTQPESELRGEGENRYLGAPCCRREVLENPDWRVAKRYHFDIDIGNNKNESKPVTHLQSGGSFDADHFPEHRSYIDPHYCRTPLDKPRLPHPPMDPLLIIHLLVEQYQSLQNIVQDTWAHRVKVSEQQMWTKYYSRINDLLREDQGSRDTLDRLFDNSF
ncbi:hypothetical protein [Halorubrum distributum]|uniref:hypothetical protein n=1 Tax=Halorubrum distributum TaxID=29283 RepID=UPI0012685CB8|nr:hypothetical protein [Halorubrum arcis]